MQPKLTSTITVRNTKTIIGKQKKHRSRMMKTNNPHLEEEEKLEVDEKKETEAQSCLDRI